MASLEDEIKRLQADVTTTRGALETAQTNARTALDEADARRKETDLIREQKSAVEKQANEFKLRQTELVEKIRELSRQLETATTNNKDLRDRVDRLGVALAVGRALRRPQPVQVAERPPPVQGEVARVDRRNQRVELTIGSDDGLVPGHELYLYRTKPRPQYLGKVRIISVDPDQAVGQVIGGILHGIKIQEGDNVSSTIRAALAHPAGRAPAGRPGVFVQAPRSDVYVALLGVALGAMIVGCILLVLILQRYDFKTKVSAMMPATPAATAAATSRRRPSLGRPPHLRRNRNADDHLPRTRAIPEGRQGRKLPPLRGNSFIESKFSGFSEIFRKSWY